MKHYVVAYQMTKLGLADRWIAVPARNKFEAYDKAVYEIIPEKEGFLPYGAFVDNVTYNNGRQHFFNANVGNPFGE